VVLEMPAEERLSPAWVVEAKVPLVRPPPTPAVHTKVDNRHVVPLVKVHEEEDAWHFWDEISVGHIAVDYFSLRGALSLYHKALEEGIHAALGFDGRITIVLVGKDWELDRLDISKYAQDVKKMGADAVSTPDDYTYITDPPLYRMSRISNSLNRTRDMISQLPGVELVGVVKGSTRMEIEFHIERLMSLGIKVMAFPCSEYMEAKRYTEPAIFVRICKDRGLPSWVMGANSLGVMRSLGADCYSGTGWCYGPLALGLMYERGKWIKAGSGRFHCNHPECQVAQDLHQSPASKARHNIRSLMEVDAELAGRRTLG